MKIVKKKKFKIHCFEKFLNKIFKNGKKYKFFKFLKNILILFKILKKIFKTNILKYTIFSFNIFEKIFLSWSFPEYCITYKIKKDFKKRKKVKDLTGLILRVDNETTELYKWLYLLLYKLPIRTIQLKLYYIVHSLNVYGSSIYNLDEESKEIFAKSRNSLKKKNFWKERIIKFQKKKVLTLKKMLKV